MCLSLINFIMIMIFSALFNFQSSVHSSDDQVTPSPSVEQGKEMNLI